LKGGKSCMKVGANMANATCPTGRPTGLELVRGPSRLASSRAVFGDGSDRKAVLNNVEQLCPLPDTSIELRCIAAAIGGSVFLADKFTKPQLFELSNSGALNRYRIIDFATHGLLPDDSDQSIEPSLVTTPSENDDGLLRSSEIAQLKLNADWVILAACDT